jgi:hypothetical protein
MMRQRLWLVVLVGILMLVLLLAILEGPAFAGYHHCGAGDALLGGRELRFFGQLWCKQ